MPSAGRFETGKQRSVRGVEKENADLGNLGLQCRDRRWKIVEKSVSTDVNYSCYPVPHCGPVFSEDDHKLGKQRRRDIVDGEHSLIFKHLQSSGFACSGHAGENDAFFHALEFTVHETTPVPLLPET
jgi:hypothetical protein